MIEQSKLKGKVLHQGFNRLFSTASKTTLQPELPALCEGNPPVTGGFPSQRVSYTEIVSMSWRHNGSHSCCVRGMYRLLWNLTKSSEWGVLGRTLSKKEIQWKLSIRTTSYDTSLSSRAHPGGRRPPGWAPEDREGDRTRSYVSSLHYMNNR